MYRDLYPKLSFELSLACAFVLIFSLNSVAQHSGWRPVTSEELQQKAPKVEPDADAEAILWEIYVADESVRYQYQTTLHHYLKVKIFNERGRETFSKFDIPFGRYPGQSFSIRIRDIEARTTKPDGTVVELNEKDVFERDLVRGDNVKLKAKSFATPGIEPGVIVEVKWREIRDVISSYQRLEFARDIPVQLVRYFIKPLEHPTLGMMGQPFNIVNTPFKRENSGHFSTTVSNVPAFREEPRMAPEYAIRPWMLLYYSESRKNDAEKFWKEHGRSVFKDHKELLSQTDEIKRAAADAIGSETSPSKKIELLFYYSQSKIKDVLDDQFNYPDDFIRDFKWNKNASEALKRGLGTSDDVNHLFAAMAIAAGFDARIAKLPRRSDIFFPRWLADDFFMRAENVAINLGGEWQYFDPGSKYVPFGMLRWEEEGQPALISDSKEPIWHQTILSGPAKSAEIRKATLRLSEDGTLEGRVTIEYSGHLGALQKEYNDEESAQARESILQKLVRSKVSSTAEVTGISIENVTETKLPCRYSFDLKVPGYASRTGRRMFVQPNIFEKTVSPMFQSSKRQHEIYFQYPYSEHDDITIDLPPGYELESPDSPGKLADPGGIAVNEISMSISKDGRRLTYRRRYSFGLNGALRFETANYPALKRIFDAFHTANTHTMSLRPVTASADNKE
jgi:hypothetical protein